jgi:RsiW-degrading membrane proteinase PrsW (M82 family)
VYAVSVSLGFAAFENVLYVLGGGITVAVMRALLSIPGHAVFAVYMGYFYGKAKKASVNGRVTEAESNLSMAFISSSFLHGFYDFCLTVGNVKFLIVFLVFFIAIVILAARKVNKLSREDAPLREMSYFDVYNGY